MSLQMLCERCERPENHWNVKACEIRLGQIHRKPMLCETCIAEIQTVIWQALRQRPVAEARS